MLRVEKLSFSYDNGIVLKSVSFDLEKGERIVLVGESGCGKTTLLKTIAGFLQPKSGKIYLDDEKVLGPKEQLVPGHKKIKLVNQDFGLDNFHTVEENIRLRLLQFNKSYITYRVEELLKVTGLEKNRNFVAHQLSGGQKQRLAIARALADEPELLLLDEPFNQLDYFLKQRIETYIDEYLTRNNISVILVSHSSEETMRWGDRVMFLKSGRVVRTDTAENFYNYPSNKKEAGFFGEINTVFIDGKYESFRPNDYAFSQNNEMTVELSVIFVKSVYNGWYVDNLFKVGNRIIHLYNGEHLSDTKTVFIKPMFRD